MILVTGGAGYIGSHTVLELLEAGHRVVVLDNLCNSSRLALERVEQLTGKRVEFVLGDILDRDLVERVFRDYPIEAVMHFAGLKAVGESVREPLHYYETNVGGSIALCQAMRNAGVYKLVFSSSATVYGESVSMPIREDCPTGIPTNPYGQSKLMAENVLKGLANSDPCWSIGLLRYFNPIGAHPSGRIGEDPNGIPNNLLPYMLQVAVGRLKRLSIYGNDYPTADGTGVRDYIHVMDLALAHVHAVEALMRGGHGGDASAGDAALRGHRTLNLGVGRGVSVLELVRAFETASGRAVPYRIVDRRPGDVAEVWADPSLAERLLGWKAGLDVARMCEDAWRWQSMNPDGYGA